MEQNKFYQIKNVTEHEYTLVRCDGSVITRPIRDIDKSASAFNIQDAKAGDVLVYETDEVEWIFIYREIVPAASEVPHDLLRYYFLLEGNYFNWNGVSAMITDDYKLYLKPATKEQQDTFFAKMEEAGYEWDSEKKELKKIEPKALDVWNAEDEQNLNVVLSFIPDECLRRWLKDKLCYDTLDANKVIEWLKNNGWCTVGGPKVEIAQINKFKKDFGL